jgi:hypothetical protein
MVGFPFAAWANDAVISVPKTRAVNRRASDAMLSPRQYPVGLCEVKLDQQAFRCAALKVAEDRILSRKPTGLALPRQERMWTMVKTDGVRGRRGLSGWTEPGEAGGVGLEFW